MDISTTKVTVPNISWHCKLDLLLIAHRNKYAFQDAHRPLVARISEHELRKGGGAGSASGLGGVSASGPGGRGVSEHAMGQTPLVDRFLDTRFWKYYLALTWLRTVNIVRVYLHCAKLSDAEWKPVMVTSFTANCSIWIGLKRSLSSREMQKRCGIEFGDGHRDAFQKKLEKLTSLSVRPGVNLP